MRRKPNRVAASIGAMPFTAAIEVDETQVLMLTKMALTNKSRMMEKDIIYPEH
jgi:hypothetical protein